MTTIHTIDTSRRDLLRSACFAGTGAALASCASNIPHERTVALDEHSPAPRTGTRRFDASKLQTIGVLGIGAQATVAFQEQLHHAAQRQLPAQAVTGYPPTIVYHHRRPPIVVNDDFSPALPMRADPQLLDAARWLASRVDFFVMTSNGAHQLCTEIESASGRPIASMIEATLAQVQRRGWRRVGVLGFFDSNVPVYTRRMRELGLASETIDARLQDPLNEAVFRCMEGREDESSRAAVRDAVASLRARGVDGIIPGCTELPLLLGPDALAPDLVNPSELLAEAAVLRARST